MENLEKFLDVLDHHGFYRESDTIVNSVRVAVAKLKAKTEKDDDKNDKEDEVLAGKSDPCWKNYEQIGTKSKGGREVPNCVPKSRAKK